MSFNRDDRRGGGGRSNGFGRSFGGGRDRSDRPVEMHKAVCSKCGKECEVPFRPTGAKPVFCNDCFREQGGPDRRSEGAPRNFERRDDRRDDRPRPRPFDGPPPAPSLKPQLDEINSKLDMIMKMLTQAAPVEATAEVVKERAAAPKKPRAKKEVVEEVVAVEEPVVVAEPEAITPEESTNTTE
jgi:CxxC-x17-CxxC domain-containing protein